MCWQAAKMRCHQGWYWNANSGKTVHDSKNFCAGRDVWVNTLVNLIVICDPICLACSLSNISQNLQLYVWILVEEENSGATQQSL